MCLSEALGDGASSFHEKKEVSRLKQGRLDVTVEVTAGQERKRAINDVLSSDSHTYDTHTVLYEDIYNLKVHMKSQCVSGCLSDLDIRSLFYLFSTHYSAWG